MIVNVAAAADSISASIAGLWIRLRPFRRRFPTERSMPLAATGMSLYSAGPR
jgi:hypothetical protein